MTFSISALWQRAQIMYHVTIQLLKKELPVKDKLLF